MEKHFDQVAFFELVQRVYKNEMTLADWMSKHFDYSRASAYRRIRGETPITGEEMNFFFFYVREFGELYVNNIPGHTNILMEVAKYKDENDVRQTFLKLIELFEWMIQHPECKLRYTARDVMFFQFLNDPDLLWYKLEFWNLTSFSKVLNFETIKLGKRVFDLYTKVHSEEIWSADAYKAQWLQIKDQVKQGMITEEMGRKLYDALMKNLNDWHHWVVKGEKTGGGKIKVVARNYVTMNNCGILTSEQASVFMGAVDNARFYSTNNEELIKQLKERFNHDFKSGYKMSRAKIANLQAFRAMVPKWDDEIKNAFN